ncbi:MAG: hypothetical protein ACE5NC_12345 [Anaerolineae bacterium]
MAKRQIVVIVGLAVLCLGYAVGQAQAQLPPGVHLEVIAEYPSTEPGIEKIVVKKFTLDPGAKLENFTPQYTQL